MCFLSGCGPFVCKSEMANLRWAMCLLVPRLKSSSRAVPARRLGACAHISPDSTSRLFFYPLSRPFALRRNSLIRVAISPRNPSCGKGFPSQSQSCFQRVTTALSSCLKRRETSYPCQLISIRMLPLPLSKWRDQAQGRCVSRSCPLQRMCSPAPSPF